jgi:hypothetical protein
MSGGSEIHRVEICVRNGESLEQVLAFKKHVERFDALLSLESETAFPNVSTFVSCSISH